MRQFLQIIAVVFSFFAQAQNNTSEILTFEEFQNLVKENHPIAMQANLQTDIAASSLSLARGFFDPKVQAELSQKYFKQKEYYDLGNAKLKVPTWFGVELEGGYERNEGVFLNPENNTPSGGLWFAGISVPIGRGLFIDERRAELRKAQIMQNLNEAERRIIVNDLLFNAGVTYWEWFQAFHNLKIYEDARKLADERSNAVKKGAELGELPLVDTLEAKIQFQNRKLSEQEAILNFKNKSLELSVFLWKDGLIPLELNASTKPETLAILIKEIENTSPNNFEDSILNNHPEFIKNRSLISQLKIDERWSREQLKPELNVKYKPLTEATGENPFNNYSINNYTWGLQFEFPIFLRKERSKLKLTQFKLAETELKLKNKQQQLYSKVQMALNELEITKNQIQLAENTQKNYKALLEGERQLFTNGESSLFLVNSRELGYINSELKLVSVLSKFQKSKLKFSYSLGVLE